MTTSSTLDQTSVTPWHRHLLLAAAGMTYLLITLGGIVCVTESGRGCPDWPGCYGQVVPPLQSAAIIEYLHRFIAALTGCLILIAAFVSWQRTRARNWISRPSLLALGFLLAVVVFGALAVLQGIPPAVAVLDIGSALTVLALMLTAAVVAFSHRDHLDLPDRLAFHNPFARLALLAMGGVFLVLVSGVLVAGSGSPTRCLGWPLYNEAMVPGDWIKPARSLVAGLTSLLIVAVVVQAWRTQHQSPAVLRAASILGLIFLVETVVGVLLSATGEMVALRVIYVAAAAAVWAMLVVVVVLAGLTARFPAGEHLRPVRNVRREA
jgi:heme a synthase